MLEDHNAAPTMPIICHWLAQFLVLDGTLESQQVVIWIYEVAVVLGVWVHHGGKHIRWELGAEVNNVAKKAVQIYLGRVDIDNSYILGVLLSTDTNSSGRGKEWRWSLALQFCLRWR